MDATGNPAVCGQQLQGRLRLPWLGGVVWLWLATLLASCSPWVPAAVTARADVELFSRQQCPHCADAKAFLDGLQARRPGLTVVVTDVAADPAGLARLRALAAHAQTGGLSVPALWVRGVLVVGFADAASSGARIEALLDGRAGDRPSALGLDPRCSAESGDTCSAGASAADSVTLPWLGEVRLSEVGLPLFTLAIGLVDGFNPCAMWVLLFLLSFLASLNSRRKMVLIAGEFVVVSAAVYYAFMAAWLTAFSWLGLSRPVQVAFGLLGLLMAVVNIKDFFAFHQGLTLSIPKAAKPGLYRRMRAVVQAETLPLALLSAAVLAVLVNFVELLCTAGLPALYTQVLAGQPLAPWQRYAYLGLYIVAYMLDDAVMVSIAVVTLGRAKLQERGGRWLKLLSGAVLLILALLLLFKPDWLV